MLYACGGDPDQPAPYRLLFGVLAFCFCLIGMCTTGGDSEQTIRSDILSL